MTKIVIVAFDDWEALFVDGKCDYQNHSISLREVAEEHPDIEYIFVDYDTPLAEVIEDTGTIPYDLDEIRDLIKE